MRLQVAPNASPAMIEAGNSNGREAKALKQTARADSVLIRIRKMQRGVPRACNNLSGMYLHGTFLAWNISCMEHFLHHEDKQGLQYRQLYRAIRLQWMHRGLT
jgi:hypothetical protein